MSTALEPTLLLSLDERRDNIVGYLQDCALDIGAELQGAKRDHPGRFLVWVEESLPFGIDKAERLMAVSRAFFDVEPDVRELLPTAWSTLFELSRLPSERFQDAVEAGEVHPGLTLAQSRALADKSPEIHPNYRHPGVEAADPPPKPGLTCDLVARALTKLPRTDLTPQMEEDLRKWLDE